MTMQGDSAELTLERDPSEDAADLQGQEEPKEPSLGEQLAPHIREQIRAELAEYKSRTQAFSDRTEKALQGMAQDIAALASKVGYTEEIRDLVADLHEISVDPTDREKRALERKVARMEREAQEQPKKQEPDEPQGEPWTQERYSAWWQATVGTDIDELAQAQGIPLDVINTGAAWTAALRDAGAPTEGIAPDASPAEIRRYKEAWHAAVKKVALDRRVKARPKATVDTANGGGGGKVTWEQAQKTNRIYSPDEWDAIMADQR